MDLASRFRKLRTDKDFSVYKLAKISEVSENYIRAIEKGDSQPSVQIIEKLLSSMGTTLSEFFNESGEVLYPTPLELELVQNVRTLSEEKAAAVLQVAKLMNE